MKLPVEVIRVMGTDWKVRYDDTLLTDDDEWGDTNARLRIVSLHPDGDQPTLAVHELIHTIEHALNLDDLEEAQVQGIARGLVAILADNPVLRDWIFDQLK